MNTQQSMYVAETVTIPELVDTRATEQSLEGEAVYQQCSDAWSARLLRWWNRQLKSRTEVNEPVAHTPAAVRRTFRG